MCTGFSGGEGFQMEKVWETLLWWKQMSKADTRQRDREREREELLSQDTSSLSSAGICKGAEDTYAHVSAFRWDVEASSRQSNKEQRHRLPLGLGGPRDSEVTWWGCLVNVWERHQVTTYVSFPAAPNLWGGMLGEGNFLLGLCLSPGSLLGSYVSFCKSLSHCESGCL